MDTQPGKISVLSPIEPALERVKLMLFSPVDIEKWLVIGFCAWLAQLGSGGFNFNSNFGGPNRSGRDYTQSMEEFKEFFFENMVWLIPAIVGVVIFAIALTLVLAWLSSRGQFMFLHCVAGNKAEVKNPWNKYGKEGNSLFLFRVVVGLIGFICMAISTGALIAAYFLFFKDTGELFLPIVALVIFSLLVLLPLILVFFLIGKFTRDFAVPIMYLNHCTCRHAWREFLKILSGNKGQFTLYLLFQIVIYAGIFFIKILATVYTCCCACCFMSIPYIGTVVVLPILIFTRSYSLYYLRQFGPAFDVYSERVQGAV